MEGQGKCTYGIVMVVVAAAARASQTKANSEWIQQDSHHSQGKDGSHGKRQGRGCGKAGVETCVVARSGVPRIVGKSGLRDRKALRGWCAGLVLWQSEAPLS